MESHVLSRIFEFNGVQLPDPNPKLSVEDIRTLYAHQFLTSPRPQSPGRRRSGTSCAISSPEPSAPRGNS
jgi:hypothetical protein